MVTEKCSEEAERCRAFAIGAETRLKPLRELVLDADFFKVEQFVTNPTTFMVVHNIPAFRGDIILILRNFHSSALRKPRELISDADLH